MNKIYHSCRLYNCILNSKRQNHILLTKRISIISNTCCFATIHQVKYFRRQGWDRTEQKLREAHLVVRQWVRLQVWHRALYFQINPGRMGLMRLHFWCHYVLVLQYPCYWFDCSHRFCQLRWRWDGLPILALYFSAVCLRFYPRVSWENKKTEYSKSFFLLFWTSSHLVKSSVALPMWLFNFHCIFCFVLFCSSSMKEVSMLRHDVSHCLIFHFFVWLLIIIDDRYCFRFFSTGQCSVIILVFLYLHR